MGKCLQLFTWECDELSCCESYHFRVLVLFSSIGLLIAAVIVLAIWLLFEFRPAYRKRVNQPVNRRCGQEAQSDAEMLSFEETRYLRRLSENKLRINQDLMEVTDSKR